MTVLGFLLAVIALAATLLRSRALSELLAERVLRRRQMERATNLQEIRARLIGSAFEQTRREIRKPPRIRPRLPSLSGGLLRLAERRLPEALNAAERERWTQEMRADVASLPRRKRLRVAFNAWRKGAPDIPTGPESAPSSVRD